VPPVDEATFILKADAVIAALQLVAVRLDGLAIAVDDFKVSTSLNAGALANRIQQLEVLATDYAEVVKAEQLREEAVLRQAGSKLPRVHGTL
jgi:hypothetical protein